jgi:choline dehydrogenase-like flavoprotein
VKASKEVILSAGPVNTPSILMHSGIGDREELAAVGVEPILHLPSVGKNASDQPLLANAWFVNSTDTIDQISRNTSLFNEDFRLWNITKTGPFVDSGGTSHLAMLRLPRNASIFQQFPDPSAGPQSPHFEMVIGVCINSFTELSL